MQLKTVSTRRTLGVIILAGCVLSVAFYSQSWRKSLAQSGSAFPAEDTATLLGGEHAEFGLPVRITIPKIKVDAAVEYVGLTEGGAMDVPKSPDNVAWYELGPRPGEKGSAVIAGHFGWKNGIPAVFDDVYKLRKGDKLYLEDEKGAITEFVVRELRTYDENENASSVFGSSDGKAHLNLITCEGIWNKTEKSYSKRLVIFTDKISDEVI